MTTMATKRKRSRTSSKNPEEQEIVLLPPVTNHHVEQNIEQGLVQHLINFPPGFRFSPTDPELIRDYLWKKIADEPLNKCLINSVDIYSDHPQVLTERYVKYPYADESYFFTPRQRKYPNGARPNRSTSNVGYWKATGSDKKILFENEVIGYKKSLVYYVGEHKFGVKTNWIMHELRTTGPPRQKTSTADMRLDDWVLCRIFFKSKRNRDDENEKELSDELEEDLDEINANDMGDVTGDDDPCDNNMTSMQGYIANTNNSDMGDVIVDYDPSDNSPNDHYRSGMTSMGYIADTNNNDGLGRYVLPQFGPHNFPMAGYNSLFDCPVPLATYPSTSYDGYGEQYSANENVDNQNNDFQLPDNDIPYLNGLVSTTADEDHIDMDFLDVNKYFLDSLDDPKLKDIKLEEVNKGGLHVIVNPKESKDLSNQR